MNERFNQPIARNVLPQLLQHLTFGHAFNQPIEREVLPPTLIVLCLLKMYAQPIGTDVLPDSLRTVVLPIPHIERTDTAILESFEVLPV